MTAVILEGKPVALELMARARDELDEISSGAHAPPTLAILRVGDDESSVAYQRAIDRTGTKTGITVAHHNLDEGTTATELKLAIEQLNQDPQVSGIIVLQPLPDHLSRFAVADVVAPEKDIDGITTYNAGRLFHDDYDVLAPSTPAGGMALLKHYDIPIEGKHAVVVGRSSVVGKPMAMMLLAENATVTVCHSRTPNLAAMCKSADILVSAVGSPHLINGDYVKDGAVVVDFGVNFLDGKMTGDVCFDEVRNTAASITPVPGGTGRVTTMVLVRNTIKAARQLR